MEIEIKILDGALYNNAVEGADLPQYHTAGACAIDLRATEDATIPAGATVKMGSGLAIWTQPFLDVGALQRDHSAVAAVVIPRSGLGTKGLVLGNLVGLIDEDYQGEVSLTLWNRSFAPMEVKRGDRVAQMMFILAIKPEFRVVEEFSESTARGEQGHGSTGVS